MIGMNRKILACIGSAGCGLSFICRNMESPMISGQAPSKRNSGGVNGINPNRLNMVVGSRAERSWIQP